jgi:hypothetical protein
MAFASEDYIRVLSALFWPITKASEVQTALTAAEGTGVEQVVKDTLDSLDTVIEQLSSDRTSGQQALVQADVLSWEPGARLKSLERERTELQFRLANLLGLNWGIRRIVGSGDSQPIDVIL